MEASKPEWLQRLRRISDDAEKLVHATQRLSERELLAVDPVLLRSNPPFGGCCLVEAVSALSILKDEIDRVEACTSSLG